MSQKKQRPPSPGAKKAEPERDHIPLSELVEADVIPEQDKEDPAEDHVTPGDGLAGFGVVDIAAGEKTARPLDPETALELLTEGANSEAVMNEMDDYTRPYGDSQEDFALRQLLNTGTRTLYRQLREHTFDDPLLSGGDVDAAWDDLDSGEEAAGGTVRTPDQDNVDELGEAIGLTYEDDAPLNIEDKLTERRQHRWELDPASAEEEE